MKKPKKNFWEERSRMSNIPKLRFPEFKGEWEEKKLGECLTLLYGKDWKDKSSTKKLYPVLGTGGVISYIDEFIYDKPCVLIGRKGSINNPVFIDKPFWTVDTQFYSEIHEGYSPKFLYYIFCTENWSKHDESTGVPSLSAKNVENTHKHIPSYSEQQKIADFLSNVDSIITAETKILNTLQKKKKALMQKLFTRQLRFKSDDGKDFPAWEEKKLGDVCSYIGGGTPSKKVKEYWNGNINWASVKDITGKYLYETQDKISQLGADSSATNICEPDSLLLITRMSPGKTVITKCITAINQDLKIVKSYINVEFLHLLFQSIQTKIDEKTSGTTVKGISIEGLNQIDIRLPCKAEQQKIADCLSSMDSLIQTQQKVVTTWQQRKKALLQQMFI